MTASNPVYSTASNPVSSTASNPVSSTASKAEIAPLELGVCSWSLQVRNVPELRGLTAKLGLDVVSVACGDPHHASWDEGDAMPATLLAAGLRLGSAMIGFPGEDYTTPQHIQRTGGFGDPATRAERLRVLEWALARTRALGLSILTFHGGFIPEPGSPDRKAFLDTLARAGDLCRAAGVTAALETGQETADLLRRTLDDLRHPAIKVNFDPANMILYDMGDPIRATELLAPDIVTVHCKDANRTAKPGTWGDEVVFGTGQIDAARWLRTLKAVGYRGPLYIEREVGNQAQRFADIATAARRIRELLAAA